MIAHKNQKPPTKAERERIDRMMPLGCVLTWAKFGRKEKAECHHITEGRKRLGHWYTIPLSPWYHRGVVPYPYTSSAQAREALGASLADGSKAFFRDHGYTEHMLWQRMQLLLDLDDQWPLTKIFKRKVA